MFIVHCLIAIVLLANLLAIISAIFISTTIVISPTVSLASTLKDHMAKSYCQVGNKE
jgi:hypothetical protein